MSRPITVPSDPLERDPQSVWATPGLSLWGWGEVTRIDPGPGEWRFDRALAGFDDLVASAHVDDAVGRPGSGPIAFASMAFSDRSPASVVVIPRVVVGRDPEGWWMTQVDGAEPPPPGPGRPERDRVRYAGTSVPEVDWMEAVAEAIKRLGAGELDKVVLARDYAVWSRRPFHPPALLAHLVARFPACHVFRVADLVGASPELLVSQRGDAFTSLVLAGTAAVYEDATTDAAASEALRTSEKEQWEHRLALESVTEALTPISVDVAADDHPSILRLANVQHLATRVTARLHRPASALATAGLLHPTAAVGGTPTTAAVALIDELEGMDRGRYAAPVGWIDWRGDGDFAIALRCAELSGARARLFAGSGLVADSLPEAELAETRLKLQAMMGALEA